MKKTEFNTLLKGIQNGTAHVEYTLEVVDFDPEITLLGIYQQELETNNNKNKNKRLPKDMHMNVHCSLISNS